MPANIIHDDRDKDQLMTANEVAEMLAVSREWVYEQSRRGSIPTVSLGRYRRYRRSSVLEWIAQIEASEG